MLESVQRFAAAQRTFSISKGIEIGFNAAGRWLITHCGTPGFVATLLLVTAKIHLVAATALMEFSTFLLATGLTTLASFLTLRQVTLINRASVFCALSTIELAWFVIKRPFAILVVSIILLVELVEIAARCRLISSGERDKIQGKLLIPIIAVPVRIYLASVRHGLIHPTDEEEYASIRDFWTGERVIRIGRNRTIYIHDNNFWYINRNSLNQVDNSAPIDVEIDIAYEQSEKEYQERLCGLLKTTVKEICSNKILSGYLDQDGEVGAERVKDRMDVLPQVFGYMQWKEMIEDQACPETFTTEHLADYSTRLQSLNSAKKIYENLREEQREKCLQALFKGKEVVFGELQKDGDNEPIKSQEWLLVEMLESLANTLYQGKLLKKPIFGENGGGYEILYGQAWNEAVDELEEVE